MQDNFNTIPTGTPEERRLVHRKKAAGQFLDKLKRAGLLTYKVHSKAILKVHYATGPVGASFRKIAELPEFEALGKPNRNQISKEAA